MYSLYIINMKLSFLGNGKSQKPLDRVCSEFDSVFWQTRRILFKITPRKKRTAVENISTEAKRKDSQVDRLILTRAESGMVQATAI